LSHDGRSLPSCAQEMINRVEFKAVSGMRSNHYAIERMV
jgi:hypothetical protein